MTDSPGPSDVPPRRLDDPAWVDDIVASAVARVTGNGSRGGDDAVAEDALFPPAPPDERARPQTVPPNDGIPKPSGPGKRIVARPRKPVAKTLSDTASATAPISTLVAEPVADVQPEANEPLLPGDELDLDREPDDVERRPSSARGLLEWVVVIVGALLVAVLIKTFLFQAFYIPSGSMLPTLQIDDRVLVNKLSYDLHDVNRGDLVVFERPEDDDPTGIDDLIKRVIGLPGDTLEVRDSVVFINGVALDEPYLPTGIDFGDSPPVVVPDDHVFVMGDNRTNSSDSRVFGAVPVDDIVGRAFFRIWPLTNLGFL